ncbi:MAG: inorganic diphosphatase, partial [Candidatus Thiodiazotropha taylori]|nr:inorganic diphosphatase [Candidatus Thiodiazotropha taylori]MCW4231650.1 inorganic diphosphatase [Candidatus Thiodiazotropha taylori]
RCRPVAVLKMTDESGDDAKVVAVPADDVSSRWTHVKSYEDMPEELMERIAHFFEHYKDLDEGKWVRVSGWEGAEAAKQEVSNSVKMFQDAPEKPNF